MRSVILAIVFLISIVSCTEGSNQKKNDLKKDLKETSLIKQDISNRLFITTAKVYGTGDNQKTEKVTEHFNQKFLDIDLIQLTNGKHSAEKELISPTSVEDFKLVVIILTDENGENIHFNSKTEFLNFMDEKGYEPLESKETKYKTSFTFKKI